MKIGIIGAGKLATALAPLFVAAGHEVGISNSRDPETLVGTGLVLNVYAMTPMEAVSFADIVIIAIPFGAYKSIPREACANKIVIDATNFFSDRDGNFPEILVQGKSSSELIDEYLAMSGSRVVKAFNTMHYEHIGVNANPNLPMEQRKAIFMAGDDVEAKRVVGRLIQEIGFAAANTGNLRDGGRRQQPGTVIFNADMTVAQAKAALAAAETRAGGAAPAVPAPGAG